MCKHMITQGRENEQGSWCVNCGEKVLEVEWRVCRHCVHFKATDTIPICTKKLMAVLPDMHVTYYVKDGSCWEATHLTPRALDAAYCQCEVKDFANNYCCCVCGLPEAPRQ